MGGELRDKVASGVAWSLGEKLGTILLQMVVSIVVARLLMPDDVGLMALMTFFSSLALVVVDSGFSQMLIRKGDPAQGDYKSVFLFNVVVSWIVYGVLVAVFPAVAAFYGRPILARIAPVLFLLVPVNALGTIQNTIFMRQFRFALLSKITFVASLASGVLAVTMALAGCGVELSHLEFTSKASTALAFVSLAENGQRTFSFCRKPSADLLYAPEQIDPGWFSQAFALHFCSVSLVDSPMRYAHLAAITAAREAGAILSFDPNLRFPLWPDREQLRQTVWQFLPLTHILKLSDEELPFLTGTEDIEAALPALFTGDVQLVLYTCGSKGARAYTRTASARARSPKVTAVDTTGAGDGFIGSFLWQLQRDGVTAAELPKLSRKRLTEYLAFSNRFCAISVQRHGALDSYPTLAQMEQPEADFPLL